MKRVAAFVLVLAIICSSTLSLARASEHLSSYNITVGALSGGVMRITASVSAVHPNMKKIGFPEIALYEWNGIKWVIKETHYDEYTYDAGSHAYQFTYQGTPGVLYYALASFYAEDTKGSDRRSASSASIYAKS